jgi:LPXTG-motif cell wall-anchored protein
VAPAATSGTGLPFTGAASTPLTLVALAMVGSGLGLFAGQRRRKR